MDSTELFEFFLNFDHRNLAAMTAILLKACSREQIEAIILEASTGVAEAMLKYSLEELIAMRPL